jgi:hypothetical protein
MSEAIPLIIAMYKAGIRNFFLHGGMGCGKTSLAQQIADAMAAEYATKVPCIIWRAGQKSLVDGTGVPVANRETKRTQFYVPDAADLPNEERDGPLGVWCLDELNSLIKQLQGPAFGMVEDRVMGETQFPKEWLILATGNRVTDNGVANNLAAPFNDRFAHFNIEPDVASVTAYAHAINLPNAEIVCKFLEFRQALLFCMPDNDAVDESKDWRVHIEKNARAFPTPRSHFKAAPLWSLPQGIRETAIASKLGLVCAAEIENFLAVFQHIPSVKEVVADPENCRLPDQQQANAGARFAVVMMLANAATVANIEALRTYAARMGREFEAMLFADAGRRDPAILEAGSYVETINTKAKGIL